MQFRTTWFDTCEGYDEDMTDAAGVYGVAEAVFDAEQLLRVRALDSPGRPRLGLAHVARRQRDLLPDDPD